MCHVNNPEVIFCKKIPKLLQNIFAAKVFRRNLFEICKLTFIFGALGLKSFSARAYTAWGNKLIFFLILHSPFSDLMFRWVLFIPSNGRSKVWFMLLCFAEIFTSPGKFSWHALLLEPIRFIGLMYSEEPQRDLAVVFGPSKFPSTWFYLA